MKKIITIFSAIMILTVVNVFAQTPQAFKYQAIARDISGNILMNQNVSFRISILQGSVSGTSMYTETQTATTNQFGLANLNIGNGTVVSGNFSTISWGTNIYFVKMEFDATGGSSYVLMGTSQLLSVPYSLYSKNAGNSLSDHDTSATNELQTLSQVGTNVMLSNGGGTISVNDGDTSLWKASGSDIYFNSGRVRVGTSSSGYNFSVAGGIEIKQSATPGVVFSPNVSATKNGNIFQTSDQLVFGANGMTNIGSIDLNAPPSFNIDNSGALNYSQALRVKSGKTLEIYNATNSNYASFYMNAAGTKLIENYTIEVNNGDVYVSNNTKGIILVSPNGSCWRVTVDNTGNLVRTSITCP